MDVAVIAKLIKLPPQSNKPGDEIQKATFEVTQVIKGEGLVKANPPPGRSSELPSPLPPREARLKGPKGSLAMAVRISLFGSLTRSASL